MRLATGDERLFDRSPAGDELLLVGENVRRWQGRRVCRTGRIGRSPGLAARSAPWRWTAPRFAHRVGTAVGAAMSRRTPLAGGTRWAHVPGWTRVPGRAALARRQLAVAAEVPYRNRRASSAAQPRGSWWDTRTAGS